MTSFVIIKILLEEYMKYIIGVVLLILSLNTFACDLEHYNFILKNKVCNEDNLKKAFFPKNEQVRTIDSYYDSELLLDVLRIEADGKKALIWYDKVTNGANFDVDEFSVCKIKRCYISKK